MGHRGARVGAMVSRMLRVGHGDRLEVRTVGRDGVEVGQ